MKFKTTKIQCQTRIDEFKGVCRGCGGIITPIKTVDNSGDPTYWSGCTECAVFDNGTSLRVHTIAKRMVIEERFRAYSFLEEPDKKNQPEEHKHWLASQTKGACSIVLDILTFNQEI